MKNEISKYSLGSAIIGGFIVWIFTIIVVNSDNIMLTQMIGYKHNSRRPVMQNSNVLDQKFIEQMIPHHEDAIIMAKLVPGKSSRSELLTLSKNIVDSQAKEIERMKNFYFLWFGKEVQLESGTMQHSTNPTTKMGHTSMSLEDMDRLKNSNNFDREFIEAMIPHHQMAVMMASMLRDGTTRSDMKKLATEIINTQSKEIEQMKVWLKEWK